MIHLPRDVVWATDASTFACVNLSLAVRVTLDTYCVRDMCNHIPHMLRNVT